MKALRIATAFKIEAVPFIDHFALKPCKPVGKFPLFANGHHALVLSGLGKSAAAAATEYLHKQYKHPNCIWLNIGIAGHTTLPIGTIVLANQITDQASGETWSNKKILAYSLPTSKLITVNSPETDFKQIALYDMEAAGFYTSAMRITEKNRVYCLKVVSDNKIRPAQLFSTQQAAELMQKAKPALVSFINTLLEQETV